jgi:hypothetical protein
VGDGDDDLAASVALDQLILDGLERPSPGRPERR